MSEEIKKEAQDVELNPEELDTVAGGYHVDGGDYLGGDYFKVIGGDSGTIIPCCIYCGKWFSNVDELNEHLKKEHS